MIYPTAICLLSALWVLAIVRRGAPSLGLPLAYLLALLLVHLPGAIVHMLSNEREFEAMYTEIGIWLTAYAVLSYGFGLTISRMGARPQVYRMAIDTRKFSHFCVVAGWLFILLFIFVSSIPTLGALISRGGTLWMLGVALGLRAAVIGSDLTGRYYWLGIFGLYPAMTLLSTGFLASATNAAIIILAPIAVVARNYVRVAVWISCLTVVVLSLFLNYFLSRDAIREAVWGGAGLGDRLGRVTAVFHNFEFFDPTNPLHIDAFDIRLNQNYFVGVSANRIDRGDAEYWLGQTIWEGVLSLIPRVVWPDKPVAAGSGDIVRRATGLPLSETTSWGVGQVLEFYLNFGLLGLVVGFFIFGWLIGKLDKRAAEAAQVGNSGDLLIWYLPAVAMVFPDGSMVDVIGGVGASFGIGMIMRKIWKAVSRQGRGGHGIRSRT